jgi:hypothetical protein
VPVNEPPMDGAHDLQGWIHGTLVPAVRQAAPNRPVLSAWGSTADADDIHIYAGFWQGAEGEFREVAAYHAAARVPGRILANTEYIEGLNPGRIFRWSGLDAWTPEAELRYAWIGADQTEILRLLRYDLVLPYWFANWNRRKDPWRADAPTPMFAALKSALAPVGVVLDLEDRNHAAGSVLETTVVVMNDSDAPVQTRLRVVLATSDPQWDPQAVAGEPVLERTVSLPPHSRERVPVSVRLPAQEVERVLVAQVGPAISTRPLRSVAPPTPSGLRVRVLGASPTAIDDLRRLGLDARAGVAPGRVSIDADRLLVWEDARLEASTLAATGQINRWVQGGGRLVVLAQRDWQDDNSWTAFPATAARELFRFTTSIDPSSTIWPVGDPAWWQGLPRAWCDGWNGGDLAITDRALNASWLPGRAPVAQTPHGWVPEATAAAARILPIGDAQHAFPADEPDRRFFATDGSRHRFSHLRTQPLLLCTRQPAPEGGWALRLPVTAAAAATSRLLVFEHGRAGSSPFRWRIDGGAWQESPASSNEAVRVHAASNVWFGWTDLGVVTLSGGAQVLEVRVERPCADGVFRLAWDDLLLAPPPRGQVLAVNGSRRPVLVQVPVDRGQAIFCQLRIADRLDPARSGWDPVAGRLLLHLLGR